MTRFRRDILRAIAAAIVVAPAIGCSEARREIETTPSDWIVAVDLSGSRSVAEIRESRQVVQGIVARIRPGGRLTLTQVGGEPATEWRDSVPRQRGRGKETAGDRRRRDTWNESARAAADLIIDPTRAPRARVTDLLNTLFHAADDVARSAEGRTTLVLLSDMINESAALDLAHGDVPGPDWIANRNTQGLLPHLRDVCVAIVGASVSTARGVAVREFWRRYLAASGARVREYRRMTIDAGELECPL